MSQSIEAIFPRKCGTLEYIQIQNYRKYRIFQIWNKVKGGSTRKETQFRNFNSEVMIVAKGDDVEVNSLYKLKIITNVT